MERLSVMKVCFEGMPAKDCNHEILERKIGFLSRLEEF